MVVVEPRALSVFAKGLDEVMTRGYTVTAYLGIEPFQRQTPADSLFSLFAPPDLLYIVKVLLSLIAVLFAYDAVSGEKETGTLKLVLSSAISRGRLVAGKMLGGLAAIMLPLVTLLTGVVVVLVTQPGIRLVSGDFARLGLLVVAAMLYVALFFALGMLVSTLARTSSSALMVLLLLWAGIVFAIPNVGNLVAEQLAPAGSAQTQEMLRRQGFAKNRFLAIQSPGAGSGGQRGGIQPRLRPVGRGVPLEAGRYRRIEQEHLPSVSGGHLDLHLHGSGGDGSGRAAPAQPGLDGI